ncbi:MAG: hypothetical protein KDA62_04400 [Planctomycetales bacterium]|nr:hypothetical protein [Planctomycetales bacterium]
MAGEAVAPTIERRSLHDGRSAAALFRQPWDHDAAATVSWRPRGIPRMANHLRRSARACPFARARRCQSVPRLFRSNVLANPRTGYTSVRPSKEEAVGFAKNCLRYSASLPSRCAAWSKNVLARSTWPS